MTKTLTILIAVLSFLIGGFVGYQPGHYFGKIDGVVIEKAKQTNAAAIDGENKATKREAIDDKVRKMVPSAIDNELSVNGWLRD